MAYRAEDFAPVRWREARRRAAPEPLVPTSTGGFVRRRGFEALVRSWPLSAARHAPRRRGWRSGERLPLEPNLAPSLKLLLAAQRGEPGAFDALIAPLREPLVRIAERRMPPRMRGRFDAHDVVQSTCLRAFRHLDTFRIESGGTGFLAWLVRVLDHAIQDEVRRHGRLCRDPGREAEASPSRIPASDDGEALFALLARKEDRERLGAAFARLSRADRTLLAERFFDGLTHTEIARRHRWSEPTARRRQKDALARLSSLL